MKTATQKIIVSSMLAALTCVATMIIKIPSPLHGYLNLGDGIVLLAGWMLSPMYGFLSAGLGSALADILSGYIAYAPATFMIKGLMAVIAFYGFKLFRKKNGKLSSRIISGTAAEIMMILGYFVFEGFLYGFVPSLVNIPANGIQGGAGLIIGIVLVKVFEKQNIFYQGSCDESSTGRDVKSKIRQRVHLQDQRPPLRGQLLADTCERQAREA